MQMNQKEYSYPAVFYYEWHPLLDERFSVHVRFPDLIEAGLPASTSGIDQSDATASAKKLLQAMLEQIQYQNYIIPSASPIEKISIDRGINISDVQNLFRIEIKNITIDEYD